MNLWPFSKKQKQSALDSYDFPDGVSLEGMNFDETPVNGPAGMDFISQAPNQEAVLPKGSVMELPSAAKPALHQAMPSAPAQPPGEFSIESLFSTNTDLAPPSSPAAETVTTEPEQATEFPPVVESAAIIPEPEMVFPESTFAIPESPALVSEAAINPTAPPANDFSAGFELAPPTFAAAAAEPNLPMTPAKEPADLSWFGENNTSPVFDNAPLFEHEAPNAQPVLDTAAWSLESTSVPDQAVGDDFLAPPAFTAQTGFEADSASPVAAELWKEESPPAAPDLAVAFDIPQPESAMSVGDIFGVESAFAPESTEFVFGALEKPVSMTTPQAFVADQSADQSFEEAFSSQPLPTFNTVEETRSLEMNDFTAAQESAEMGSFEILESEAVPNEFSIPAEDAFSESAFCEDAMDMAYTAAELMDGATDDAFISAAGFENESERSASNFGMGMEDETGFESEEPSPFSGLDDNQAEDSTTYSLTELGGESEFGFLDPEAETMCGPQLQATTSETEPLRAINTPGPDPSQNETVYAATPLPFQATEASHYNNWLTNEPEMDEEDMEMMDDAIVEENLADYNKRALPAYDQLGFSGQVFSDENYAGGFEADEPLMPHHSARNGFSTTERFASLAQESLAFGEAIEAQIHQHPVSSQPIESAHQARGYWQQQDDSIRDTRALQSSLVNAMDSFEQKTLLDECRFVKKSIDDLVNRYFAQQASEEGNRWQHGQ